MRKITTCYLSKADIAQLNRIARRHGISRNAIVRFGVQLALMVYDADQKNTEVRCVLPRKGGAR